MDNTQVVVISVVALLMHACHLMCHPTPWYERPRLFLPGPQFCPDTGRTVCTTVDYYPTDQIFHLLTSARSQIFNLSSIFVDERKGDIEPNIAQIPLDSSQDGYEYGQPPPGGHYSTPGRNAWRPTSAEKPQGNPRNVERWNQSGRLPTGRQNGERTGLARSNYWRQSRAQNLSNQRRNSGNPNAPTGYNINVPTQQRNYNTEGNTGEYGYGVTQHNRVELQDNVYTSVQPSVPSNFSGYFPQRPQGIYQMQPPYLQHNVKGHTVYPVGTVRPPVDGNWKGSPDFVNHSTKTSMAGGSYKGSFNRRIGSIRRERRNQDVEEACRVSVRYVPPRAALNDNSEWKYVINIPERNEKFSQVIRVEVCQNEGEPCSSRISMPYGFSNRCKQKYIKKRLLSLNADGQGTAEDNFFVPSCCVCEIIPPSERK